MAVGSTGLPVAGGWAPGAALRRGRTEGGAARPVRHGARRRRGRRRDGAVPDAVCTSVCGDVSVPHAGPRRRSARPGGPGPPRCPRPFRRCRLPAPPGRRGEGGEPPRALIGRAGGGRRGLGAELGADWSGRGGAVARAARGEGELEGARARGAWGRGERAAAARVRLEGGGGAAILCSGRRRPCGSGAGGGLPLVYQKLSLKSAPDKGVLTLLPFFFFFPCACGFFLDLINHSLMSKSVPVFA